MTLIVHSMATYAVYAHKDIPWRQHDYNANKFVKSLKGEPINGYATILDVNRQWVRITNQSSQPAYRLFAKWAIQVLDELNLGKVILVPVPSSDCVSYKAVTVPVKMARAIQGDADGDAKVRRWLRFVQKMPSSHAGGTRNQSVLEENMRVSAEIGTGRVVLIDDVKTTGAHLRACAAKLRRDGITVETALVAATTVWTQHPTPFAVEPEDLEGACDFEDSDF